MKAEPGKESIVLGRTIHFKISVPLSVNVCLDPVEPANALKNAKVNSILLIHRNWIKFLSDCTIVSSLRVLHSRGFKLSARPGVCRTSCSEIKEIVIVRRKSIQRRIIVSCYALYYLESNIIRCAKSAFFVRSFRSIRSFDCQDTRASSSSLMPRLDDLFIALSLPSLYPF